MKKIYIAGKVTGLPIDQVTAKFAKAQEALEARGFCPVNPITVVNDPDAVWNAAMKKCIAALVGCDAVFLLPCYINSPGANFELQIASRLEIPVCTMVDDLIQNLIV